MLYGNYLRQRATQRPEFLRRSLNGLSRAERCVFSRSEWFIPHEGALQPAATKRWPDQFPVMLTIFSPLQ